MRCLLFIYKKYSIIFFISLLFAFFHSCNLFHSNEINASDFNDENMILKWKAELKVNSENFVLFNSIDNTFYSNISDICIKDKSVFLFIPSSACNSCFTDMYMYLISKLKGYGNEVIIVCDETNIRPTLFLFPDNLVLSTVSLDSIQIVKDNNFFISPFLFTKRSDRLLGPFILKKNDYEHIDSYIDFWILQN